jgi:tetratricopeptide (TPR) repeat protein
LDISKNDSYSITICVRILLFVFKTFANAKEVIAMTSNEVLLTEAKSLFATGHTKESIELFSRAEDHGCNPVTVYLSRGAAFLNIGELDKSINDFDRVLEIDADNERAFFYRGIAHLMRGDFSDAVNDLSTSIKFNHDRGAAFLARGMAHAELDHTDESLQDMKTAIAFSSKEVEEFASMFGENRTFLDKSMALLEGERGPWSIVMNEDEVNKLKKWIED